MKYTYDVMKRTSLQMSTADIVSLSLNFIVNSFPHGSAATEHATVL